MNCQENSTVAKWGQNEIKLKISSFIVSVKG